MNGHLNCGFVEDNVCYELYLLLELNSGHVFQVSLLSSCLRCYHFFYQQRLSGQVIV